MDDFTIKIEDGDDSAKSPKKSKISKVETKRLEEVLFLIQNKQIRRLKENSSGIFS